MNIYYTYTDPLTQNASTYKYTYICMYIYIHTRIYTHTDPLTQSAIMRYKSVCVRKRQSLCIV